jgi:hypothetical protein
LIRSARVSTSFPSHSATSFRQGADDFSAFVSQ